MKINRVPVSFLSTVVLTVLVIAISHAQTQTETQKILAGDGDTGDFFGQAVDIDQDTIIVSSRLDDDNGEDSGSVYFFERENGIWVEQQKVIASDGSAADEYGFSVAIQGDVAAVGAFKDDDNGSSSGSVWILSRSNGVWSEDQKLTASDGDAFDNFGGSVAIDGETIVVGAIGAQAAYVFTEVGGNWTETQVLTPSDGEPQFANTVDISGDTILVGSFLDDTVAMNAGSVYVYERSLGVWNEVQELTASDFAAGDNFGGSVAVRGETILAGAFLDDDNGDNSGSGYAFDRIAGVWSESQKLTASDGASGDGFGRVRLDDDDAVIGASAADGLATESGVAYVFKRSSGLWSESVKLVASDGDLGDMFSLGLAIDKGTVIAGTRQGDDLGAGSGAAYIFVTNIADIDIRPKTPKNHVNPTSNGLIPVAILGSLEFDVTEVDPTSVRFGPAGGLPKAGFAKIADVNSDGFADLTVRFHTAGTGIACGDPESGLFGQFLNGAAFGGTDAITTLGCN